MESTRESQRVSLTVGKHSRFEAAERFSSSCSSNVQSARSSSASKPHPFSPLEYLFSWQSKKKTVLLAGTLS